MWVLKNKKSILPLQQNEFKELIRHKINHSIEWWENFTLEKSESHEILKTYEKLFMNRNKTPITIRKYYEELF